MSKRSGMSFFEGELMLHEEITSLLEGQEHADVSVKEHFWIKLINFAIRVSFIFFFIIWKEIVLHVVLTEVAKEVWPGKSYVSVFLCKFKREM